MEILGKLENQRMEIYHRRGEKDNRYVLRSMMWVDNYWLFCDSKDKWVCMVNDIIEELLDLDMEPENRWSTRVLRGTLSKMCLTSWATVFSAT